MARRHAIAKARHLRTKLIVLLTKHLRDSFAIKVLTPQSLLLILRLLRLVALRLRHRHRHQLLRLQMRLQAQARFLRNLMKAKIRSRRPLLILSPLVSLDQHAQLIAFSPQNYRDRLRLCELAFEIIDLRLETGYFDVGVVQLRDDGAGHQSEGGQNRHGDNPFLT